MTRTAERDAPGPPGGDAGNAATPQLSFTIENVEARAFAATPTLVFTLAVTNPSPWPIRTAMITAQVRIATARRHYGADDHERLADLFGSPDRWGDTLRSLLWTHATVVLPEFETATTAELLVPCTYDFDVVATKYLHGVRDGDIPLELLFSGSVFYTDAAGLLRTTRVNWETDAVYRMPVRVWRELMDRYYPQSAWIRMHRDVFDRLAERRSAMGLPTWDLVLEQLLDAVTDSPVTVETG